jgi:hypothetical protein
MDTLSHGLWATAVAKGVNLKFPKKIKLGWMALWGISPDVFSFTPVIIWMLWQIFYKGVDFSDIPRPETMPPEVRDAFFVFRLSETLYHISHSFVIFLVLFFLAWIFCWYKFKNKQKSEITTLKHANHQISRCTPYWEMTGWFIHIVMDIPTHSKTLYPTLFLWPLSDCFFDGDSWGNMPFIITNYTSLLIVFILLRIVRQMKFK